MVILEANGEAKTGFLVLLTDKIAEEITAR